MSKEVWGKPFEIECDKCKKPVLIMQLTPSILNFNVKCHRCGTIMEGENFTSHPKKVEDEYYRKWQDKNN